MVEDALAADAMADLPGPERCEAAVTHLESDPTLPISRIATERATPTVTSTDNWRGSWG